MFHVSGVHVTKRVTLSFTLVTEVVNSTHFSLIYRKLLRYLCRYSDPHTKLSNSVTILVRVVSSHYKTFWYLPSMFDQHFTLFVQVRTLETVLSHVNGTQI